MSTEQSKDGIEGHGTALDSAKKRVKCKYCEKEVNGFSRLRHHLASVGSDVQSFCHVSVDIKARMRNSLLEKKRERLTKEVGQLYHPDLPLKRILSRHQHPPSSSNSNSSYNSSSSLNNKKSKKDESLPYGEGASINGNSNSNSRVNPSETANGNGNGNGSSSPLPSNIKQEESKELTGEAAKSIGLFFLEAGIDPAAVNLPSFKKMVDAILAGRPAFRLPSSDMITGPILQGEVIEMSGIVEGMRGFWKGSGCTVIIDSWKDRSGKSLLGFLVYCAKGTVFLRSADASESEQDVDALASLISGVVDEVGPENVVQVISHDASCYMQAVGQRVVEKYRLFWNLCADYCIDLLLSKLAEMDHVQQVLTDAKSLTRFIYCRGTTFRLMDKYIEEKNLIIPSMWRHLAQFRTLDKIVSQRENLRAMFRSPEWASSRWASKAEGKAIAEKVKGESFWISASDVLKITNPLVGVLEKIFGSGKTSIGSVYNAMDQAKEEIKMGLKGDDEMCMPYYAVIDEVWNNYLHSSIHAAGYYLNPALFYNEDFYMDAEVANGLLDCTVRMAEDLIQQKKIAQQLEAYRAPSGVFDESGVQDQRMSLSPVVWWSLHGKQHPELQKFAISILSQTCCGASRYGLDRGLTEMLHSSKGNWAERDMLHDREFVRNNTILLHLDNGDASNLCKENMDVLGDWVA